eukprot:TRINITY_DN3582_c0_g1_i2.p1 TRINITY_DN3582_c0_g1~~TRINITY_DN3582_c0_g1_i2.p1  ORF type:complete len:275 (+),score=93.21 TRINITY_DN3582_c0_g1_i2:55-825(+)
MAELAVYVRHCGDLVPIQVSADATAEDLYGAVRQAVDMQYLVLSYQGDDLPSDATPLADTGLSAEAVVEVRKLRAAWCEERCGHCIEHDGPVVRDTYVAKGAGRMTGFWRYACATPSVSKGKHKWSLTWTNREGVHPDHVVLGIGMDADQAKYDVRSDSSSPRALEAVVLRMFSGVLCTCKYPSPAVQSYKDHSRFTDCVGKVGLQLTVVVDLDAESPTATFSVGGQQHCVDLKRDASVCPLVGFYEGLSEVRLDA